MSLDQSRCASDVCQCCSGLFSRCQRSTRRLRKCWSGRRKRQGAPRMSCMTREIGRKLSGEVVPKPNGRCGYNQLNLILRACAYSASVSRALQRSASIRSVYAITFWYRTRRCVPILWSGISPRSSNCPRKGRDTFSISAASWVVSSVWINYKYL